MSQDAGVVILDWKMRIVKLDRPKRGIIRHCEVLFVIARRYEEAIFRLVQRLLRTSQ